MERRAKSARQAADVVGVGVGLVGDDVDGVGGAVPHRPRRVGVAEITVLLADLRDAVELEAAAVEPRSARLGLAVPVAVRGHDREVLLAGVLHRVVRARRRHVGVDAVFLAAVVAADPSQAFARRRSARGNLLEELGEPLLLLAAGARVEVADRQEAKRVDAGRGRRGLRLHRDEADALGVVERREGQAGCALDERDPGPVIGVPDGEVVLLGRRLERDVHLGPQAAAGRAVGRARVALGARCGGEGQRFRPGVDVVVGGLRGVGERRRDLERVRVVGDELRSEVGDGQVGDRVVVAESGVAGCAERLRREQAAVVLLRKRVLLRRVVVERVALRRLVADARRAHHGLDLVGHVGARHRARRIHQQHDVGLHQRRRGGGDRSRRDIGLAGLGDRCERQRQHGRHATRAAAARG